MSESGLPIPSNHRLAERRLIVLIQNGEWEIDSEGRIWRLAARAGLRWSKTFRASPVKRRRAEKLLPNGYLMVRLMIDGHRIVGAAHRLVWQHLHGDIPAGMTINHKNGLKGDNRPDNLELATYKEQAIHARAVLGHFRRQNGVLNNMAVLTEEQVIKARSMRVAGYLLWEIGGALGISEKDAHQITTGGGWKHVNAPLVPVVPPAQTNIRCKTCGAEAGGHRFPRGWAMRNADGTHGFFCPCCKGAGDEELEKVRES